MGGSPMSRVSDGTMVWLGRVMLVFAVMPWIFFGLAGAMGEGVFSGFGMASLFLGVMYFVTVEMVTHRELPRRGLCLLVLLGPFALSVVVGIIMIVFE